MDNYNEFNVDDWLSNAKFQNWVFGREVDLLWLEHIQSNVLQLENIEQAKKILLSIRGELEEVNPEEVKSSVSRIIESLEDSDDSTKFWWKPGWLQVAATILLVAGLGGFLWKNVMRNSEPYYSQIKSYPSDSLYEFSNDTDHTEELKLPDGSTVVLQGHSRISFPQKFSAEKREVFLLGEAFFDIRKNPSQPFYVYANELVTKVLGTSFHVKAYQDDQEVKVTVRTGKVSVYTLNGQKELNRSKSKGGILLTPNQEATMGRKSLEIVRKVVAQPVILHTPAADENFSFNRTNASKVFKLLEKTYGVKIEFDEALIENCTITAKLANESLFEKLDMICTVMESSYESIDGQILIDSKGCK